MLALRSLISSLNAMVNLPLSHKAAFAVADIIQMLREIEHITKEWKLESNLLEFLYTDNEVQNVFMNLLCREFEIIDRSKADPEQLNHNLVWQISKSELISILSQTCTIISNLTCNN